MLREDLGHLVTSALDRLIDSGELPESVRGPVEILDTKQPDHGDYATNFALTAAKRAGMNPRDLAEKLRTALLTPSPEWFVSGEGAGGEGPASPPQHLTPNTKHLLQDVDLAGPGFLNFRLKPEAIAAYVGKVLELGAELPKSKIQNPKSLNVEFVSVNPNGPITVGSGRGAAFGDTLCRVLEAAGHTVHREYYINDGVNSEQMRLFTESVKAICLNRPIPDRGYQGDYVARVGEKITVQVDSTLEWVIRLNNQMIDDIRSTLEGSDDVPAWIKSQPRVALEEALQKRYAHRSTYERLLHALAALNSPALRSEEIRHLIDLVDLPVVQSLVQAIMIERQREDLLLFGVDFDTWYSEQSLHDSNEVAKCIDELIAKGAADEEPQRTVLKMARGGVIESVEKQGQTEAMEDEDVAETTPQGLNTEHRTPNTSPGSTLWLRSTKFGDDMDRVLRRRDGRLTYIASDVAYHKDKLTDGSGVRGTGPVDKLITILGPDHHGYIARLQAVVAALLEDRPNTLTPNTEYPSALDEIDAQIFKTAEERDACKAALEEARRKLEVVIFQIVRFVKDGKPAPMRKRDGNIYELRDLINEVGQTVVANATKEEQQRVGADVARFFYLMRSHDTAMDFDIDLATKQSDDNPVFYVQYAHARICSVIRKAETAGIEVSGYSGIAANTPTPQDPNTSLLTHSRELTLIKKILDLPLEVKRAADDYGVHRIAAYAIELARTYHHFYDACRVIQPDQPELSQARLALCEAARLALKGALDLLGISAPERMDREE